VGASIFYTEKYRKFESDSLKKYRIILTVYYSFFSVLRCITAYYGVLRRITVYYGVL